ncbi:hypothetical protein K443DRAFT_72222, partial [Laccaria amethystina LaAM-08-1]
TSAHIQRATPTTSPNYTQTMTTTCEQKPPSTTPRTIDNLPPRYNIHRPLRAPPPTNGDHSPRTNTPPNNMEDPPPTIDNSLPTYNVRRPRTMSTPHVQCPPPYNVHPPRT